MEIDSSYNDSTEEAKKNDEDEVYDRKKKILKF